MITVSVYALVTVDENELHRSTSFYNLLQTVSVKLFVKLPLERAPPVSEYSLSERVSPNQRSLCEI